MTVQNDVKIPFHDMIQKTVQYCADLVFKLFIFKIVFTAINTDHNQFL